LLRGRMSADRVLMQALAVEPTDDLHDIF
jgi:hypothetical protein